MKKRKGLLIGAGVIVVVITLCCSAGVFTAYRQGAFEPTPTPTLEPTQTPTLEPTLTPTLEPTPTPTLVPTQTPEPTLVPTQTPEPATMTEEEYLDELLEILNDYAEGMSIISDLMNRASVNTGLMFDDDWRAELAVGILLVIDSGDRVRELDPPPGLEEMHSDILDMAWNYDRAMLLMIEGIEEVDADKLNRSADYMSTGNEYLGKAMDKMNKMGDL